MIGKKINFLMDGRWPGKGIVVEDITDEKDYLSVCLIEPCKEFDVGLEIAVFPDEIVEEK